MAAKMDNKVSRVKELIQKISEDLLESEQERTERGQRPVFEVSELVIDLAFAVSRTRRGRAVWTCALSALAARRDARTSRPSG